MRDKHDVDRLLLAWAAAAGRTLEIREATTPWAVLVAEVMSQQTQIERVAEPWRRFVELWPTPADLAGADNATLLRAWAGLGYNRRALALRKAARQIVLFHDGAVPFAIDDLERLAGVGPYTARAVAATAFGAAVAPLDVNVRRVLERVVGRRLSGRRGQRDADALVDETDPRAWVNAAMDLAAAICLPSRPRCPTCPIAGACASRGAPDLAPARPAGPPQPRFASTTRWLRGRVVACLRDASPGAWLRFDAPIGEHPADAVRGVLVALEREGFVARRGDEARLA